MYWFFYRSGKEISITLYSKLQTYREVVTMETGTVKWFNSSKGYGFIERENGSDIFVHYQDIASEGYRNLNEGDKVQFVPAEGQKGPKATEVTIA